MQDDLLLEAYHYDLPSERIAQHPADRRDHSRLLVLQRSNGMIEHKYFSDISDLVTPGDVVIINDTKVFPARLTGRKLTGGFVEVFLLAYPQLCPSSTEKEKRLRYSCEALIKSSRKPKPGSTIIINENCHCTVLENMERGKWSIELDTPDETLLSSVLEERGDIPLPPYINRDSGTTADDELRYQTVYAHRVGAVAAPTAGLHFTRELLDKLRSKGIRIAPITLHVGYGTFSPVESEHIAAHKIHGEHIEISKESADIINQTKNNNGTVWAVGTTSVRAVEYAADENGRVLPCSGWCELYITPGYGFRVIDHLITNFHLPKSSLMFLVAALCGRQKLLECYMTAIKHDYRFYSYGDAMAIIA